MPTRTKGDQPTLPGLESALCGCGCGKYFMRSTRGRKRQYINNTHKVRAARALAKARQGNSTVRLQPLGWLYLRSGENRDIVEQLWHEMDWKEREVIRALCALPMGADELVEGVRMLFGKPRR